ncbi:MAG TPA: hypothetical protein VF503_09130 [Sphingobium sp.]|uniref:hypothetical protein n=1 Tax=Sphingobium sp. TaxID=1912891 RepID=UPI002ED54379
MSLIANAETLAALRDLDSTLAMTGTRVAAALCELEELQRRDAAIRQQVDEHAARRPEPDVDVSNELGELLAANPDVANSADWLGRARDLQAATTKALAAWEAQQNIIAHAGNRLAEQITAKKTELDDLKVGHDAAYGAFTNATAVALHGEFERRFELLSEEILVPLAALSRVRHLHGEGYHQPDGNRPQIHRDSRLSVHWSNASDSHERQQKVLYPVAIKRRPEEIIADLRERLAAGASQRPSTAKR